MALASADPRSRMTFSRVSFAGGRGSLTVVPCPPLFWLVAMGAYETFVSFCPDKARTAAVVAFLNASTLAGVRSGAGGFESF